MCVCVCGVWVGVWVFLNARMCMHVCVCTRVCAHACVHVHACAVACMCVCVHVCVHACACGGGWVHVGVCMRVYPIIQVTTKIYLLYFLCIAMYLYLQMIDNKMQNLM